MSDIDEFQRRITAALDRIGQGLETLRPEGEADEADTLRQQLDDEKLANAQLEERVKALRQKHESRLAQAEKAEAERAEAVRKLDSELQSLRSANQQLRESNAALRDAMQQDIADPHLVNKSMMAELEALRATQAAQRAEVDAVMTDLAGMIDAASGEAGGDEKTEDA
ncbi:MAG: hypothetical protein RI571_11625 [Roseovarius sp.]|nr:hypothetical protein [Roseovarius sp.]